MTFSSPEKENPTKKLALIMTKAWKTCYRDAEKGTSNSIEINLSINNKCDEVAFIGHVTKHGLKADPKKVEAMNNMEKPTDVAGVQRFVGMAKYLTKFLPDLLDMCEPLRQLTHKDEEWNWGHAQEAAFEAIKKSLSSAPVLKYFDPKEETEGQGDASDKGLGYSLMQKGQPVTFASRALTPAETRYSQIEKELLALIFGLERNHQYTFRRKITLWTDHKPLVSISKRPITVAPRRLQRLLLRLSHYDVDIVYKPGREMYLADTLSRAYLQTSDRSKIETETECINMLDFLPVSKVTLKEIQTATTKAHTCQVLRELITNGWPEAKSNLTPGTGPYFQVRDELS